MAMSRIAFADSEDDEAKGRDYRDDISNTLVFVSTTVTPVIRKG